MQTDGFLVLNDNVVSGQDIHWQVCSESLLLALIVSTDLLEVKSLLWVMQSTFVDLASFGPVLDEAMALVGANRTQNRQQMQAT